jgi:two-component system chemotaxis sensor kinase CheA
MDFLEDELEEILNIFQQESVEILDSMDKNLLVLEKNPSNNDASMRLFRDAHSLKGSARMLGFNNIQNVAHKIEDVLGFIKEKKFLMTANMAQVISKALECVAHMVAKTVENKKEYVSPDIMAHILALESLLQDGSPQEVPSESPKTAFAASLNEIEALITESLYMFTKFKLDGYFENFSDIKDKLKELEEIFKSLGQQELSKCVKKAVKAAPENDSPSEKKLLDFGTLLDDIASKFNDIALENNITPKNYYEIVAQKLEQKPEDALLPDVGTEKTLLDIANKITRLEGSPELLFDIKTAIVNVIDKVSVAKLKDLYGTFLRVIKSLETGQIAFNKDTASAMSEIIQDSVKIFQDDPKNKQLDIELLNQRALIVEQMSQINIQISGRQEVQEAPQKVFSAQDWLDSIDSSSIKTLRINSSKLDQLVNQIGDLIVTRIKTTEQLNLARNIQNEFMDWQKSWHKMGNYIKYFDKKHLTQNAQNREIQSIVAYNKQLMSLFNAHSDKMASLMSASQGLYKQLQENDIKLSSISTELETMVKNMRVLPLATIFHLFPRMVHNIAKDNGKSIDFKVVGSDVSVDKKIIEDIKIPLMHIIRNSIDHGIETPDVRSALGKSEVGSIVVRAKHQENKIIIDIEDDGRGIDVKKIKEKAVQKGILTHEEANTLPEEQIVGLIFYPSFSTEETVTELSGRGLGLDIVHTKISQLNGRVDVRSDFNKGTITTISLPASMATVKAFIVYEQDQPYAVSTSSIKTVLRIRPDEVLVKDGKNYFIFEGKAIPVFTLSQILQFQEGVREADKYTLMVIASENIVMGVIVEKLLGDQEILHRKLPLPLFKVKNIAGITTLASGETCLILNVVGILSNAGQKTHRTSIVATNKALEMSKNSKHKILVVDDSLTTRTLEKNILTAHGYQVSLATNALDGLKIVETEELSLIVTDNEMPEISGLEFVEKIRENPQFDNIPIIALSSLQKEMWQDKFLYAGAQKYIQKGEFNQEDFIEAISALLDAR